MVLLMSEFRSTDLIVDFVLDKENRSNRFEGKRILDARKAQDGPRDQRVKDDRNNRRNRVLNGEDSGPATTGE